jgi:hypothetical protein
MNASRVFTQIHKNTSNYKLEFSFCHSKAHLKSSALGINSLINHSYENIVEINSSEIHKSYEEIYDLKSGMNFRFAMLDSTPF